MRTKASAGAGLPAGRRRLTGPAWLAVIALLINMLLPTALAGAAISDASAAGSAFCGHAPAPSDGTPVTPPPCHCVYCLVTAVGPAPAPPALHAAQEIVEATAVAALIVSRPPRHIAFAAAQPRAPPFAR